jgi:hypothetical protein
MDLGVVHGVKFEDWLERDESWGAAFNGDGRGGRAIVDVHNRCLAGSSMTMIHLPERPEQADPAERARQIRLLVGTASLVDALAYYGPNPWVDPPLEGVPKPPCLEDMAPYAAMDWGQPLGDFVRHETQQGAIYRREFEAGVLVVNPCDVEIMGVPAGDVTFPSEVEPPPQESYPDRWHREWREMGGEGKLGSLTYQQRLLGLIPRKTWEDFYGLGQGGQIP